MQHDGDTDSAKLRALEEQLLEASVRQDAAATSRLLADEFQEFGSSGRIYNKAQILAELAAELPVQIHLRNFECAFPAEGVALVTYLSKSQARTALRSSLWIWRDGRWQMLFHQGTRCEAPL